MLQQGDYKMTFKCYRRLFLIFILIFLFSLSSTGCGTIQWFQTAKLRKERSQKPAWQGPRIFSIGRGASLTFDPSQDLIVPIEGMNLASNRDKYRVDVTVTGTVPFFTPSKREVTGDYKLEEDNIDISNLRIMRKYLTKVETGDTIDVAIHVQEVSLFNQFELLDIERSKGFPLRINEVNNLLRLCDKEARKPEEKNHGQIKSKLKKAKDDVDLMLEAYKQHKKQFTDAERKIVELTSQIKILDDEIRNLETDLRSSDDKYAKVRLEFKNAGKKFEVSQKKYKGIEIKLKHAEEQKEENYIIDKLIIDVDKALKIYKEKEILLINKEREYQKILNSIDPKTGAKSIEAKLKKKKQRSDKLGVERKKEENINKINKEEMDTAHSNTLNKLKIYIIESGVDEDKRERSVSTASRTFTLYKYQDYRDRYHKKRILPEDIMPFPLPEKEVAMIFGKKIAKHYFVVRLSVRNTNMEDRLISTGMIRAKGRVLVETTIKPFIRFTVPVEVAPHSAAQLYTLLDDEEVDELRSVLFRAFEFAGALASAYVAAWGVNTTITKSTVLLTGVAIPELRKLWPDRAAGYKRNIVNFAMPDLVKVPKGGVTGHKFLFFPKDKIEGLIMDQQAYGNQKFGTLYGRWGRSKGYEHPDSFVAYLTFDNMEIPFENVFEVQEGDLKLRVFNNLQEIKSQIDIRKEIKEKWGAFDNYLFAGVLKIEQLKQPDSTITKKIKGQLERWGKTSIKTLYENKSKKVHSVLSTLKDLVESLHTDPRGSYYDVLIDNKNFGLNALEVAADTLNHVNHAILSGSSATRYTSTVDKMEAVLTKAKTA